MIPVDLGVMLQEISISSSVMEVLCMAMELPDLGLTSWADSLLWPHLVLSPGTCLVIAGPDPDLWTDFLAGLGTCLVAVEDEVGVGVCR